MASIGVGRRDMSRAGGQCHYGNAATVDGADGGPVDVSSAGDAPPSGACVLNPDELTRYVNAPVKTTEVQSLISPKI